MTYASHEVKTQNQTEPSKTRPPIYLFSWSTTKSLVLGLGNPIMGDDRVGIHVAQRIQDRMPPTQNIQFKELSVSGIRLVEEILGFDHVIIVDSHTGSETEPGRIRKFSADDFMDTIHPGAPHGINFATALEFYTHLEPEKIPKSIEIYTIDIASELNFGEKLSPTVEKAADELVNLIIGELKPTQEK